MTPNQSIITRAEIEEILLMYPLGRLRSYRLINRGYANTNVLIRTESGNYVLRLYRTKPVGDILQETRLLNLLSRYHFPTPAPLFDRDGHVIWHTSRFPAVLFPYVAGHHPRFPAHQIPHVARILGGLHNISEYKPLRRPAPVDAGMCRKLVLEMPQNTRQSAGIHKRFKETFDRVEEHLTQPLPEGIIHGDLFPDNILVKNGKVRAVLDFEDYFTGPVLYDVAMAINGFCYTGSYYSRTRIIRFIRAYQTVRKLHEDELRLLPVYIAWAAVAMAAWHLTHTVAHLRKKQNRRVLTLLKRARRWLDAVPPGTLSG